ncbi:MAG: insulinase family protein [Planctomycetota bacterium]
MEQESLLTALKRKRVIQEYILSNGLKVLLCPRPNTKVVCCMIWYGVGSSYEHSGETGISHFLEHLMFKGTNQYKKGEIDLLTQIYGGMNNASTHYDFTNYYFNFAADRFEVALEIEANRMQNCLFEEHEFQSEKMVVIDELMQGKDSPWNSLDEEVYQLSYRLHPYHRPIIGWKEDLIRVELDQVKNYYRRFYQPNNATLVLVGDVSEEKTMERVRKLFGSISAGALKIEKMPVEPLQLGERRSLLELDVNMCRLSMAFHTCIIGHPDDYILDTIDNILSYGRSARLYQRLVEKEQLCRFIYTNNDTNKSAGMYWILAELMEGASTEQVEKSIQEELEKLQTEKVSEEELSKAKNVALAHHIFESESCEALAYTIGLWNNAASYKDYENYLDYIQKITPEDILSTAKKYFQVTNKNIAISLPRTHALSTPSQVEPQLEIPEESNEVDSEESTPRPSIQMPPLLRSKKIQEFQFRRNRVMLENGMVLLHYHNPQLPIVHLHTFINAGQKYEKSEQAGVSSCTGAMLLQGTHQRSALEIAQSIEAVGSVLESSSGGIACKTLRPHVKQVLEMMND